MWASQGGTPDFKRWGWSKHFFFGLGFLILFFLGRKIWQVLFGVAWFKYGFLGVSTKGPLNYSFLDHWVYRLVFSSLKFPCCKYMYIIESFLEIVFKARKFGIFWGLIFGPAISLCCVGCVLWSLFWSISLEMTPKASRALKKVRSDSPAV